MTVADIPAVAVAGFDSLAGSGFVADNLAVDGFVAVADIPAVLAPGLPGSRRQKKKTE